MTSTRPNDLRQRVGPAARSRTQFADLISTTAALSAKANDDAAEQVEPQLSTGAAPRSIRTLALLVVFRVWNSVASRTFFVPDEQWQSLEIAHVLTFGYGAITWEWLPFVQLRGFLHPLYFAAGYRLLHWLGLDKTDLIIALPRIQQALFAAACDYYTWRLAYIVLPTSRAARWTLFASCLSWFNYFSLTRTLSNSMEATLFTASLYYWHARPAQYVKAIALMGMTVLLRPTIVPLLALHLILAPPTTPSERRWVAVVLTTLAVVFVGVSVAIDGWGYAKLAGHMDPLTASATAATAYPLVALNFVRFNLVHSISTFYGTHPWHWYLTNGWPTMLGPYTLLVLPTLLLTVSSTLRSPLNWFSAASVRRAWYLHLILGATLVYSLLAHKEFRFLHCVFPLSLLAVGQVMSQLTLPTSSPTRPFTWRWWQHAQTPRRALVLIVVLVSVLMATYFTRVHQRGVLDVMHVLRRKISAAERNDRLGATAGVYQMMPCHSTPMFSYLHSGRDVRVGWLTCEPPLGVPAELRAGYQDETGMFYANVTGALTTWDWKQRWAAAWPRLVGMTRVPDGTPAKWILMFDGLWQAYRGVGVLAEYDECARVFNSHAHDDSKRRGDVLVLCRRAE
ncbi:Alg9-like mannosyltransferase family-domain-containing protein [Catenaria anguillulae PL171]|uniref:Mannosyltransferase n=1 Tax=Catenaria anguillulae PL171 TaxID=765915 RepID=A0A1Y2HRR8_9FUNG|nr:Alg9-like mannosyltransferase family-domain-containing protein [Catenaria anguillulae PL171]